MNLWPSPPPIAFTTITDSERLLVMWRILEHNRSSSTVHSSKGDYSHHPSLLWVVKHEGRQVDGKGNDSNTMILSVTKQSWREGWWSAWQLKGIIWIAEFITQICITSTTTRMTAQFMLHFLCTVFLASRYSWDWLLSMILLLVWDRLSLWQPAFIVKPEYPSPWSRGVPACQSLPAVVYHMVMLMPIEDSPNRWWFLLDGLHLPTARVWVIHCTLWL